ncbi:hypothetical protein SAMN05421736_10493 [Evansella caseinilytica]|uniref:TcaA protein NTF2-like domain-containing protein n=1 Tax=Evansella caseinilytica TaxID=1503961 RepID=A0A1H3NKQ8_9BACI|nr:hypothetical protein [Evansella caseinilytica]SDY88799.1 hypothetical protein SAMN05421736_10493 [Evansella caseinilytica]
MKPLKIMFICFTVILLAACEEEVEWTEVNNPQLHEEVLAFMELYMETWEESLSLQQFSLMERFFVPNSHVYHMQRRLHQQMIAERKQETLVAFTEVRLEENQYDEYRWSWTETVETAQPGDVATTEEQKKSYYLSPAKDDYRITAIERRE